MDLLYSLIFGFVITIIITEIRYKPRLDRTKEGKLVLWYNHSSFSKQRDYIIL